MLLNEYYYEDYCYETGVSQPINPLNKLTIHHSDFHFFFKYTNNSGHVHSKPPLFP